MRHVFVRKTVAILVVAALIVVLACASFFRQHPVVCKIILGLAIVWGIWQVVRYFRAVMDDPLLRAAPYRKIELPEEKSSSAKK